MRIASICLMACLLLCGMSAATGKKPRYAGLATRPQQTADLEELPETSAAEPCQNWAWAAGMETLLARRGVFIGQREWVIRSYGGTVCRERGSLLDLERAVNGHFTTADGRRVSLKLLFVPGVPAPEAVIAPLKNQALQLMMWRGQLYVVTGVVYNEYIASTGGRQFEIREIKLLDLAQPAGTPQRALSFIVGRDDPSEIDGMMDVEVIERPPGRF